MRTQSSSALAQGQPRMGNSQAQPANARPAPPRHRWVNDQKRTTKNAATDVQMPAPRPKIRPSCCVRNGKPPKAPLDANRPNPRQTRYPRQPDRRSGFFRKSAANTRQLRCHSPKSRANRALQRNPRTVPASVMKTATVSRHPVHALLDQPDPDIRQNGQHRRIHARTKHHRRT